VLKILIADGETRVRKALRVQLELEPWVEVVGEASNAGELFQEIRINDADILLFDWDLPGEKNDVIFQKLFQKDEKLKIIVLGGRCGICSTAMDLGAVAYLNKTNPADLLELLNKLDQSSHNEPVSHC
jgi:DNA-binding NarL/FixJ family response regulator